MAESKTQRRGLGRGLGSLIQSTSAPDGAARRGATAVLRPRAGSHLPRRPAAVRRWPRCPGRPSPSCRSTGSAPTPPSRARSSTRRRWPSSSTRSGRSGCSSRSWSGPRAPTRTATTRYELVMGERRWRATQAAGLSVIPAIVRETDDTDDAARRPAGEPAPLPAQPARGGGGLRPAARGLRVHPRGAGRPDRPVPSADLQHHPAAPALARRPAPGRRRRAVGRPRPVAARRRGPRAAGPAGPAGRRRGHQRPGSGGDRGRRRRRTATPPGRTAGPGRRHPAWPSSPTGSRTGSRPGSRSTSAGPRAGSPSSSPASTTCAGSSTSWTRAI